MKVICLDARFYGIAHTGIGRYVENLVLNLPPDPNVKVVLIVHPSQLTNPDLVNFEKYPARYHPYTFLSLWEMHWLLFRIRPDLVHIPHLTVPFLWPGKIVVTVHDLVKHYSRGPQASTHRRIVYWLKYLEYLAMSSISIWRAAHIITPSIYWKKILVDKYRLSPAKITVIYEGVFST